MTVKGKVKVMTETFPLDDAADAYENTSRKEIYLMFPRVCNEK